MRDNLDRFYTPHSTAQQCVDVIDNLNDYDLILEPSAGSGSFSTLLDNCFAYDIDPQHKDIITQDFLQLQNLPQHKSSLVIGNPPFGIRSQLAKKFISHSIDLGADTIAFILPQTFVKYTNQTMFSNEWRLVDVVSIEDNNFLLDNSTIFIPCYFFVWTRLKDCKPSIDLRDEKYLPAKEFSFLRRGDSRANFSINGNNGKVKDIKDITNSKAEHYIKVNDGYDKEEIKNNLNTIDFDFVSSVNGGVSWIGRNDILRKWYEFKNNEK